jgi:small-conductance mechanosensitive channel
MAIQDAWQTALYTSYEQLNNYLVLYVPQLMGALFLILLGWVTAWACSKLTLTTIKFISRLWQKLAREVAATTATEMKASHAVGISKAVFWVVMLFFIAAATSSVGLDFFSSWLNTLLGYVPRVLAAVFIIMAGYLLGNVVGVMAESAAEAASFSHSTFLGNISRFSISFVALVVGIEQLGINIQFITTFIIVVVGVLLFGIALAFGMGSNSFIANVIAAKQAKNHFRLNQYLKISGIEGTLIDITATMLLIETDEGRVLIPARICMESKEGVAVIIERTPIPPKAKSVI